MGVVINNVLSDCVCVEITALLGQSEIVYLIAGSTFMGDKVQPDKSKHKQHSVKKARIYFSPGPSGKGRLPRTNILGSLCNSSVKCCILCVIRDKFDNACCAFG